MSSAVVLCAGLGTRLRPLSDELAKPLMPVGDRPALVHALDALAESGIREAAINTHYRSADFDVYLDSWLRYVNVSKEVEILGTAGGVASAAAGLGDGSVVVWSGDIVAPAFDARLLVDRLEDAPMVWAVEMLKVGEGTVGLGTGGNVVRLRGERFGTEVRGGNYLSIMAIAASVRAGLPSRGCLVADVALPLLRRGETIRAFPFDGEWDDVGLPDGLLRANLRWLERRATKAFCAADAAVAPGVTLERSVVSSGARVDGAGVLRECVVLPHGVVAAPAERTLAGRTARMAVV